MSSSSPGGVGFDINCGVRLVRTNLFEKDVSPIKEQLAQVRKPRHWDLWSFNEEGVLVCACSYNGEQRLGSSEEHAHCIYSLTGSSCAITVHFLPASPVLV